MNNGKGMGHVGREGFHLSTVTPAQAGVQIRRARRLWPLDPGLRRGDGQGGRARWKMAVEPYR